MESPEIQNRYLGQSTPAIRIAQLGNNLTEFQLPSTMFALLSSSPDWFSFLNISLSRLLAVFTIKG